MFTRARLPRFALLLVGTALPAGPALAAVNPFVAPAHAVCEAMRTLEKAITPTVTAAQLPKLERTATAILASAQKLVAAQGAAAISALEVVLTHIKRGLVANRVPFLTQTLATARAAVWTQAKKDRTTNPFAALRGFRAVAPGIVARRGTHQGSPAWFVAVDLAQPRVRLLTNGFKMNGRNYASARVADKARTLGAQAAINGDFFSNIVPRYKPSGYTQTNGVVWPGTDNPRFEPSVIWSGQHVMILPKRERVPKWASHVVSARPMTLQDGKVVTDFGGDAGHAGRSRRTGVGLSKNGRVLFFVASPSATASEIGHLLKGVGADDGFTMDGGGSAQLYLKGHGYAQPSSDGPSGRAVTNLLMVRYK